MQLLEQLKELGRSMNIPHGWWLVGLVQDNTIHKITCFLYENTARGWANNHYHGLYYLVVKL